MINDSYYRLIIYECQVSVEGDILTILHMLQSTINPAFAGRCTGAAKGRKLKDAQLKREEMQDKIYASLQFPWELFPQTLFGIPVDQMISPFHSLFKKSFQGKIVILSSVFLSYRSQLTTAKF